MFKSFLRFLRWHFSLLHKLHINKTRLEASRSIATSDISVGASYSFLSNASPPYRVDTGLALRPGVAPLPGQYQRHSMNMFRIDLDNHIALQHATACYSMACNSLGFMNGPQLRQWRSLRVKAEPVLEDRRIQEFKDDSFECCEMLRGSFHVLPFGFG